MAQRRAVAVIPLVLKKENLKKCSRCIVAETDAKGSIGSNLKCLAGQHHQPSQQLLEGVERFAFTSKWLTSHIFVPDLVSALCSDIYPSHDIEEVFGIEMNEGPVISRLNPTVPPEGRTTMQLGSIPRHVFLPWVAYLHFATRSSSSFVNCASTAVDARLPPIVLFRANAESSPLELPLKPVDRL
jgi:hypothetical protein